MEAKELRIGNFVEHEDPNEVIEGIHFIDDNYYKVLIGNHLRPLNDIKPIPLTEGWLLKFGFEKQPNYYDNRWMTDDGFEIEVQGLNYAYCIWGGEDSPATTHFIGHCKYVHKLQNLYFALTGKELELK